MLNCEICGLDCRVITTEFRKHLLCNALVHVIYSRVSGQCSHTIPKVYTRTVSFYITARHYVLSVDTICTYEVMPLWNM